MMDIRPFGATGIDVSAVGVGCAGIGATFAGSPSDHVRLLRRALDAGITFYDTADLYAQGASERAVGRAFSRHRDEVVIATKGGYVMPGRRRALAVLKPLARPVVRRLGLRRAVVPQGLAGALAQDFSPAYIRRAVEASLRRLGTDHIDVYQLHSPPAALLDGGALAGALEVLHRLRDAGMIRSVGIAADHPDDLVAVTAGGVAVDAIQAPYSVLHPEASDRAFPHAARLGLGIVSRSCFASGLLAPHRTIDELRSGTERWPAVLQLRTVARQLGRPLLELALHASLQAPSHVTILGMSSEAHLEANLTLLAGPGLAADDLKLLREATAAPARLGDRGRPYGGTPAA